jgi:hydroxypyruvate isomerase
VARLNLHGTGLGDGGIPIAQTQVVSGTMWLKARDTLNRICDMAEAEGVIFTLENLNLLDHPGCPFGSTADVLALVSSVNRPQLRINLDLYHTQIGEGDLVRWCEKCLPWIGEVQVADNPGRCEPGTGEINFRGVALALRRLGYSGAVGMEAFARGDEDVALDAFRAAFTI